MDFDIINNKGGILPKFTTKYRPHLDYDEDVSPFIAAMKIALDSEQLSGEDHTIIVNWFDLFEERLALYELRKKRHFDELKPIEELRKTVREAEQNIPRIRPPEK